jgi:hypothetical protein
VCEKAQMLQSHAHAYNVPCASITAGHGECVWTLSVVFDPPKQCAPSVGPAGWRHRMSGAPLGAGTAPQGSHITATQAIATRQDFINVFMQL